MYSMLRHLPLATTTVDETLESSSDADCLLRSFSASKLIDFNLYYHYNNNYSDSYIL